MGQVTVTALILLATFCLFSNGANVQWRKLNGSPVCFETRNNRFGLFIYRGGVLRAWAFKLVHRSGYVSCSRNGKVAAARSNWGCAPHNKHISTFLTDCTNCVIGPRYFTRLSSSWYSLQGKTSSSPALVFPMGSKSPYTVSTTAEFRLWYGEDLRGHTESDNGGRACADVYAMISV